MDTAEFKRIQSESIMHVSNRVALEAAFGRRDFAKLVASLVPVTAASGWLGTMAQAAAAQKSHTKSCIIVWTDGGLSQLESFDMKAGFSFFEPIDTSVPGLQISDHFPKLAPLMHHAAVIRSMSTKENAHGRASYSAHTGVGQGPIVYPSIGSIVAMELGKPEFPLPNYVCITELTGNRPYGSKSGFLGPYHSPLYIRKPQAGVENLRAPGSMTEKYQLLERLESAFQDERKAPAAVAHLAALRGANRMMHSKEARAYDVTSEPAAVRESYGASSTGDSFLMARRLVEVGVPFVEIALGTFDNHGGCAHHKKLLPPLDLALATLINELLDRGLLDSTLIVVMGEFGRGGTNLLKGSGENRAHWNKAWSTVLIGGGIRGGQIIGRTGKAAAEIEERPVSIEDFFATICLALGIDYTKENLDPGGRPVRIVAKGEKPLHELLAVASVPS